MPSLYHFLSRALASLRPLTPFYEARSRASMPFCLIVWTKRCASCRSPRLALLRRLLPARVPVFDLPIRPQAFVTVSGIFELDMTRAKDAAPQRQLGVDARRELRV